MTELNLLSQIDSQYIGIIWLSNRPLSLYTKTGQIMNYLSNNLLGNSFAHHQLSSSKEYICMSEQFNNPFFIIHKEVKGALSSKLENNELVRSLVSQARKKAKDEISPVIGVVLDGDNINPDFLITQCLESLQKVTIKILNS